MTNDFEKRYLITLSINIVITLT